MVPDFDSIDAVPRRSLSGLQKVVDRRDDPSASIGCKGTKGFAIMAALRMRLQPVACDHFVCIHRCLHLQVRSAFCSTPAAPTTLCDRALGSVSVAQCPPLPACKSIPSTLKRDILYRRPHCASDFARFVPQRAQLPRAHPENSPGCRETYMARSRTHKRQSTRWSNLDFVFSARRDIHARNIGTKKEKRKLHGPCP